MVYLSWKCSNEEHDNFIISCNKQHDVQKYLHMTTYAWCKALININVIMWWCKHDSSFLDLDFFFFQNVLHNTHLIKDKIKIKIKTVYCHVASTWNLDVVAYIIHTYIHIHKYTYLHTYILTHKVNLGMQSLKYHKTPSLKIYISVCKK